MRECRLKLRGMLQELEAIIEVGTGMVVGRMFVGRMFMGRMFMEHIIQLLERTKPVVQIKVMEHS